MPKESKEVVQPEKTYQNKRPVRRWERRWVLQPNVIEYGREIWIQKWICMDSLNTINLGDNQNKGSAQYYERVNGLSSVTYIEQPNGSTGTGGENKDLKISNLGQGGPSY